MWQLVIFRIFSTGANVTCPQGYAGSCDTGLPVVSASNTELEKVLQIVLGIAAAICVLIIMIGGFRFVVSQGNPDNISRARDTILYALIGLVIAVSAEAIVSFVIFRS
jgi:Type IV secretion system pilin